MRESAKWLVQVAAERHHFEGLAHLAGQQEPAGFAGEAGTIRHVGGFSRQGFNPGAEKERCLSGKAGYF
jgi:hypothetical protein